MIYKPFIKQGYRPKYFSNVSSDDIYEVPTEVDTGDVLSEDTSTEVLEDLPQLDFSFIQDINYKFPDKGSFKSRMLSEYKSALKAKGLDPAFAKPLVAQDALESAWGSKPSGLYNYGGIKGSGKLMQTTEYLNGELVTMKDNFRDFSSLRDYVNYKIDLLNSPRYDVFSGDVSEFAHRVKLGGYATSPNYEQSLNNVIRNMKRGGVLKFQEGGVNDARKWYKNWIQRRADLYNSNLREYSVFSFGSLGKNLALKNLGLANVSINPSMVPEGANGVFRPAFRSISLVDDNPYTAVHEFAHSILPKSQVYKIDKIKDIHSNSLYLNKNTKEDSYLDSSEEIYSRYMALRYFLEKSGYDMNKKFTADDIEKILDTYTRSKTLNTDKGKFIKDNTGKVKNSITESFSIEDASIDRDLDYRIKDTLGRYDLDFSAKVLSDVASNTKPLSQFIKNGAKIRKFDKGTFKATFDWVSNMNGKVKDAKKKGLSYPEFWVNLRDSNRPWSIDEHGNAYTHKMAWGEYDGNYIVYPEAQVENGILVDYSKYRDLAIERALANGEYVIAPSAEIAEEFTREYKNLPWFKDFDYDTEESRVPYRRAGSYQKAIKYGVWDSPFTGNLEVPRQVISEEWVPDESFVPTIEDLAKQLTMPYEDFRDKPYLLETKRADGSTQKQWLIGYGIADKGIINKYKNSGIPKDIAQQWVIDELTGLHKSLGISEPNYHKLPWNLQLAILDAAYNTNGASFWSVSKNLAKLVRNGETDLSKLISELDHSKTVRGWLGDRSAARRALANGQYRWNWKYVDEKGRHYNPNIPLGSEDWKRALYIDNF